MSTAEKYLLALSGIEFLALIILWINLHLTRNNLQTAIDTINRLLNEKSGLTTDSKRLRNRLTALKQKRYEAGRIPK